MIHSLGLTNFRAYRKQSLQFSRLNIFAGANNSGKSSALSAINFLAQSVLQRDVNAGPIAINGPFEQLGTFLDVVHGNRANTTIGFDLEYGRENEERHNLSLEIKYRKERKATEISSFSYARGNKHIYDYSSTKDSFVIRAQGKKLEALIPDYQKQRPRFGLFFPVDPTLLRYGMVYSGGGKKRVSKATTDFLSDTERLMTRGRGRLRASFTNFDSLSPFRDPPQRTYLFTGETPSRIGRTGTNGILLLVNDASQGKIIDTGMLQYISEWLSVTNIAKGLELRPLTERHFEICIRDLDGRQHNICDVGFGCSQVLPVLIGALNIFLRNNEIPNRATPTFVVQEPEIHLHPNAQATLGTFFVSLVAKTPGQIFIETHSDNLVLRVATHVAAGHIDPKDVAIFFCENKNGDKVVTPIALDGKGTFHPKWPGGFFPQRENETLALARARRDYSSFKQSSQSSFLYPSKK